MRTVKELILLAGYTYVDEILRLEDTLTQLELVRRNIPVENNYGTRDWDIQMVFQNDQPNLIFKFQD